MLEVRKAHQSIYLVVASVLIIALFGAYLAATLLDGGRELAIRLSPWLFLVAGGLTLYPSLRASGKPFAIWLVLAFVVTFVISALGASTGRIFGPFSYGATLGWRLFDTPLGFAFNWVLVLYAGAAFVQARLQGTSGVVGELIVAVCTGCLIMFYEWMLVPVASRLDFWHFDSGVPMARNYLAWFVIGTVTSFTYLYYILPRVRRDDVTELDRKRAKAAERLVGLFALSQLVFLLVVRIVWAIGVI